MLLSLKFIYKQFGVACPCSTNLVFPWQPYFDRCFFTILSFTVLNEKFYFHFANFYSFTPFESSYVPFQWLLWNVNGFSRFWKKQGISQLTSSNDVIGPQRKRFGTPISPSTFLDKALILSEFDWIFVLTILNLGRTRDVRPAPIGFFLNFSSSAPAIFSSCTHIP